MRYIPLDKLYVPPEWKAYTDLLLDELRGKSYKERAKVLGKAPYNVWSLLSQMLEQLSYGKCFYTEFRFVGATPDVDHFRPKGRVTKCDLTDGEKHEGYWWLAFAISNFRLCAQEANRFTRDRPARKTYGKGTRFPLCKSSTRAKSDAGLIGEQPLLLDPTNPDDVKLLCFADDGIAESFTRDGISADYQRVEASIDCYNLNNGTIAKRRGRVCRDAKKMADDLDLLEQKKGTTGVWDRGDLRKVIELKLDLREMVQEYAEFSAAVRCVLQQYSYLDFIKEILES